MEEESIAGLKRVWDREHSGLCGGGKESILINSFILCILFNSFELVCSIYFPSYHSLYSAAHSNRTVDVGGCIVIGMGGDA